MQRIVNPKQTRLFDPFDSVLTEKTRKRLLDGWPGVFRHVILELMPVDAIGGHFDPTMGRRPLTCRQRGLYSRSWGLYKQITVLYMQISGFDAEAGGLELFLKDCAKICIANSHKSPIMCRLSNCG